MVLGQLNQQNYPVEALAFLHVDNRVVAFREGLKQLTTWNVHDGAALGRRKFQVIRQRHSPSRRAAMRGDGLRLAGVSDGDDRAINVWDARSGTLLTHFTQHKRPVQFVAFSRADESTLVVSAAWQWDPESGPARTVAEIMLWDGETGQVLFRKTENARRVFRVAVHAKRNMVAIAAVGYDVAPGKKAVHETYEIKVWDVTTGRDILKSVHHARVLGLAFSHNGRRLASASYDDGTVKLWNLETRQLEFNVQQGHAGIEDLVFSPDDRRLVGVTRRDVPLWDTATGHKIMILRGKASTDSPIFNPQVLFSSDGRRIAATQFDDTVCVWSTTEIEFHW